MNNLKVIKLAIPVAILILSTLVLLDVITAKVVMPIIFIALGLLNILNGYSFVKKNKRSEANLLILSGVLLIGFSFFTMFFM